MDCCPCNMKTASLLIITGMVALLFGGFPSADGQTMMNRRINVTIDVGRDATLTCRVRGIGNRRVIWKRLSESIPIAVGSTRVWPGKKYRIKRVNSSTWQLIIKNVVHTDAGEYQCRLTGREEIADIMSIIIPGSNHPYFESTQTTVTTRVGSDVILPCHVNRLRKSLVIWTRQQGSAGPKIISLRKKSHSGDKRHKVLHTKREEWSLQIRRVQAEDFGVYRCMVNTQPPITRTVELAEGKPDKLPEGGNDKLPETRPSTEDSPQLVSESFKSEVMVSQYKSVNLTCHFTGNPKPTVVWERRIWTPHGEKIVQDLKTRSNTYTLTNAQPQDAGVYVCKASNRVPPPQQARIRVKVKEVTTTTTSTTTTTTTFDPVHNTAPRVYPLQEVVYQEWGHDAELGCRAVGVPRPTVHWLRLGQHIRNSSKFGIHNENFRHHTVFSKLHIRSLQPGNFGEYQCYVANNQGDDTTVVALAERET